MSGLRDKVATIVRRGRARPGRRSDVGSDADNGGDLLASEPRLGVELDDKGTKLKLKPRQIKENGSNTEKSIATELLPSEKRKPRTSFFSNLFRKSKRKGQSKGKEELLHPTLTEGSSKSYELRLSDLGYLWMPNAIFFFKFHSELEVSTIREGLERAINVFPVVAGRLRVQPSRLELDEEEQALFRLQGNNTRNIRSIQEAGNKSSKLRLFATLDSKAGVLFQTEKLTEKEWVMRNNASFYPLPPRRSKSDEPLLKVKLSTSPTTSILTLEVAAVLADLPAMSEFLYFWSEYCKNDNKLSLVEKPSLNRVFQMSTDQYFELTDTFSQDKANKEDQVKYIWKNPTLKAVEPYVFDFTVSVDYIETLKASLSEKVKTELPKQSVEDDDEFFQMQDALSDLSSVSSYEVLVAIAFKVYCHFYAVSEGYFCVNKRGRVPSTKLVYFGVANSFAKFAIDNKEENVQAVAGVVSAAYAKCLRNKKQLDSLDLKYESLYKDASPLKGKKITFDFKHQEPLSRTLEGMSPIFVGATDFDKEFVDLDFGFPDTLQSFDFDYRRPKYTTRIVRLVRHTSSTYKISIALNDDLQERIGEVKQKFSFISQV